MKIMQLSKIHDERGNLYWTDNLPFNVKRIFYIKDVPCEIARGSHAHRVCHQFIIVVNGQLQISLDNGLGNKKILFLKNDIGIYVPPMTWCELYNFLPNTICLVLSSECYDENDYIRNYKTFLKEVK